MVDVSNGTLGSDNDINVVISASGQATSRLVHLVFVSNPAQSWSVIRDHVDFVSLGNVLSSAIPNLPLCPSPPSFDGAAQINAMNIIANSRNAAQEWLTSVLLYPGARESPAVRQFLCYGANVVPPQFEGVQWVQFSQNQSPDPQQAITRGQGGDVDEMEMDDMFAYEGNEEDDEHGEVDDYLEEEDDAEFFSAANRYQPTEEAVTQEDAMEIQQQAGQAEMIEDVGSFAQSMGASHLGRSLQLQAQIGHVKRSQGDTPNQRVQGVTVGGALSASSKGVLGGIGGAMEKAQEEEVNGPKIVGLGDSFHHTSPVSAPRLDSFKMIKVIGKGSFGKVFLVREIQTAEMFALKVLRKDNIIKRNQVEHTKTERSVLGYVNHPFIVGLKMAFQSKDKLYFVLDYCAGGELFFHLGKLGKFPEPRACFYAAEIVLAISYVHELGIIYRDLKPENVLLDAKGHVRLTDFGLSKEGINNSSSGATSFCGTPEYLAPEILNRQGHGRAVDWWSLGALLYEMLTGLPPFYCRDRERLFEKIRKSELNYPRYLSSNAQKLLRGLLTRDPNKRLGSGAGDANDIKSDTFFGDINWESLTRGDLPPPWDPQIGGSLDTSQFDREFTSMPMFSPQSLQPHAGFGVPPPDNTFEGFTFTDRQFYAPPPGN